MHNTTISEGGVLPHIDTYLLPSKGGKGEKETGGASQNV